MCTFVGFDLRTTLQAELEKATESFREALGTKKDMVRACDRRKELSHHVELFKHFPDDAKELFKALAMMSHVSYVEWCTMSLTCLMSFFSS